MLNIDLRRFMDRIIDESRVGPDDLRQLLTILAGGLTSRKEAEALLALGRCLDDDPRWRKVLIALMVDFVVRRQNPARVVTAEASCWLASALDAADLPETALHIAYAVVEEARAVDEALLIFILRGRQRAPQGLAA